MEEFFILPSSHFIQPWIIAIPRLSIGFWEMSVKSEDLKKKEKTSSIINHQTLTTYSTTFPIPISVKNLFFIHN